MKKINKIFYVVAFSILALCCFGFNANSNNNISNAYSINSVNFEEISLTNKDFNSSPTSTTLDKNPSGWGKIKTSSSATSGVINIGDKFSSVSSTYQLENNQNPGKYNNSYDDKILMINSKNSQGITTETSQGYESSEITFDSYSFYEVKVLVYTDLNAYASVYLSGFDESITSNSFENINTKSNWQELTFYIQTNENSVTSKIQLYLGATSERGSIGVVFFDNILVYEMSNNRYFTDLNSANLENSKIIENEINYQSQYQSSEYNFDFETGTTAGSWTIEGEFDSQKTIARVANLTDEALLQQYGLPNLGTDNYYNNIYGLVLSTTESGIVGFVSNQSIEIEQFGLYKISVNVKVENITGNAYIKLIENNDVNLFYGEDIDFYTPTTESIKINSNSSDKLKNLYSTASFYVAGHPLYNTSIKLGLFLGGEDDLSSGSVVFDNITVEKIDYNQFSNATSNDLNKKINLTTITSSPSVDNGYFNSVINQDSNLTYPIPADKWNQTIKENDSNIWGVVNTNQDVWNNNGLNLANPRNPNFNINGSFIQTPITDTNNILIVYNKSKSYQSLVGPTITLEKDSCFSLSFDFKSINFNADSSNILNIYIQDANNNVIFEDFNVESSVWENYEVILKTEYYSTDIKLVLEVGTVDNPAQGVVYLDNLSLTSKTYSDDEYKEIVKNPLLKVIDLSNMGFNIKGDTPNQFGVYDALMFEGQLEQGTTTSGSDELAFGGIINEENQFDIDFPETNTNILKNMLVISNRGVSTYSLTSQYDISLSASSYYKFSVYIKTVLNGTPQQDDEKTDTNYGAQFKLSGLDGASLNKIITNDFEKFEIYAYIDTASTVNVKFAFVSEDLQTIGTAFFDNFSYETITQEDYDSAIESKNVLVFSTVDKSTEDNNDDNNSENEDNSGNNAQIWIAISTIIMTVAIILAIVLYFIRKIDFKKLESKKVTPNSYDRNKTIIRDSLIKEAEKRRDEDISNLKNEIKKLENYLLELEEENKKRVEENRKEHGKTITRQAEKEFKNYVNNRNRITKDIEKLEQQIKEAQSPEYLLKLEKLVSLEKSNQLKNEKSQQKLVKNNQKKEEEKNEKINQSNSEDKIKKDESLKDDNN